MSEYQLQCFPTPPTSGKPPLCVSLFDNKFSNIPQRCDYADFEDLAMERVSAGHEVRTEKDGPAISLVEYPPGSTRATKNIVSVYGACLDFDKITNAQLEEARRALVDYEYLIYSTFSDTPESRCIRVIVPFEVPIPASDYTGYWRSLNELTGGLVDPATKDPARIAYLPAHPPGARAPFIEHHLPARGQP